MYTKNDLKGCILKRVTDGETLLVFDARSAEDSNISGGFVGSGIASTFRAFKIITSATFDFEPYNHKVIIKGVSYVLTAKQPLIRKSTGMSFRQHQPELLLSLE